MQQEASNQIPVKHLWIGMHPQKGMLEGWFFDLLPKVLGLVVPNCDLPQLALNQLRFKNPRSAYRTSTSILSYLFEGRNYHLLIGGRGKWGCPSCRPPPTWRGTRKLEAKCRDLGTTLQKIWLQRRGRQVENDWRSVEDGIPGCGGCTNCCTLRCSMKITQKEMIHFDENPMRRPCVPLPSAWEGDGPWNCFIFSSSEMPNQLEIISICNAHDHFGLGPLLGWHYHWTIFRFRFSAGSQLLWKKKASLIHGRVLLGGFWCPF